MALWRRTGEKNLPIVGAVAAGLRVLSLGSDIVGRWRPAAAATAARSSNGRSSLTASSEVPPPRHRGRPSTAVAQPPARAAAVA